MARKKKTTTGARGRGEASPLELSDLELQVMNVVWDLGECSSAEVIDGYTTAVRPLAPTTIRTVLTNIEKKGFLERVPSLDRGHRYRPAVTRESVARSSMKDLVSNLFQGSPKSALTCLLRDRRLREEDLDEIRDLIAEHDRKRKGKNSKGRS